MPVFLGLFIESSTSLENNSLGSRRGRHRSLTIQYALSPLDINRELPALPSLFTENTSWFLWRINPVGERQLPHSSGEGRNPGILLPCIKVLNQAWHL